MEVEGRRGFGCILKYEARRLPVEEWAMKLGPTRPDTHLPHEITTTQVAQDQARFTI